VGTAASAPIAAQKPKASKPRQPVGKEPARPFLAGEYARLHHTLFDDTDDGKHRMDRMLTGMNREQVDANDPVLANPWIEIEVQFNDLDFNLTTSSVPTSTVERHGWTPPHPSTGVRMPALGTA